MAKSNASRTCPFKIYYSPDAKVSDDGNYVELTKQIELTGDDLKYLPWDAANFHYRRLKMKDAAVMITAEGIDMLSDAGLTKLKRAGFIV